MLRKKIILILTPIVFAGLVGLSLKCSLDKSKLKPKETDGFTSSDMDKGQNNNFGVYPHVIDFEIEAITASTQPPWIFYAFFDKAMDKSLTPDVKLEEITNNNQVSGVNYIDTSSIKWLDGKDNVLRFSTTSDFKVMDCDNYLLTITKDNTKSILGIQMDGNWNDGNVGDDYIDAPSDFVNRLGGADSINDPGLYSSATLPYPLPASYIYDLALADVWSNDAGDYLDPSLSDASENGYIQIGFSDVMKKSEITPSNIVIKGPDGGTINGNFWVDTDNDGSPDKSLEDPTTPDTTPGNRNTYYDKFWFRPSQLPMGLGRYTGIVHCNSIHKVELTDASNGVFQRPQTCNDFDDSDGNDNDVLFEFYVTKDGNQPAPVNKVWGVYTTNDRGPFGANEIRTNQAFVLFQTANLREHLMDETTLIPQNLSLLVGGKPITVTTSIQERYLYIRCAWIRNSVWVINAPTDENLNGADLTISYAVKDKAGNTLDGNRDNLYELNPNDNFRDPWLPYDGYLNNQPPAIYVQTDATRVYTTSYNPKGYTINQSQVFVVFDTPPADDDRMNTGVLSADDLQLSGSGTGSCTCTCTGPGGSCAGDVTLATVEDITNFGGVPTTVWQITFTNPGGCNIKNCNLTIRGGSVTAASGRPTDTCGNWLYPNYTQNSLP